MSTLRNVERAQLERLLGMESGYVLDFTNRGLQQFICESAGVDIYQDEYAYATGSKANRLRALWTREPDDAVGKVIRDLIEYWECTHLQPDPQELALVENCRRIAQRLLGEDVRAGETAEDFLAKDFGAVALRDAVTDATLLPILETRLSEAHRCLQSDAPLATIFLCGSILEGLLLAAACADPRLFNQAPNSPRDDNGKVKQFPHWRLAEFIDVACEVKLLSLDVKKFGHALREFRNYIHPYEQASSQFNPDKHTAEICLKVLEAAIASLSGKRT